MRLALIAVLGLAASGTGWAADHVQWTLEGQEIAAGSHGLVRLTAHIDPGWHLYSLTTPPGPIPTVIRVEGAKLLRIFAPPPARKFDEGFQSDTETYEGSVAFLLDLGAESGKLSTATALPRYQVCSGTLCIPPVTRTVTGFLTSGEAVVVPAGYSEVKLNRRAAAPKKDGAWAFLLTAFGFGLAAIFTPCVFPMIPITMSFFLNKPGALKQALLFCGGIVVLFSALGLLTTSLLGPFGVVQLGSNVWVNALIACVFVVFALSLLGAFEITIPSFILTRLNQASEGGGSAATLLMGLTFSLASFACVGPFVGTLLAASVGEGGWRPLGGMAAFASGLALPFFALALFPGYLKKMPRSGGWLARVKVVMGFLILAAALKYVASIDQVLQWNRLSRETFLAVWVVLFAMAGAYLLGFLALEGVKRDETVGIPRLLIGMAFLAFSVGLVPGMFGGRLGELEGFVPPPAASAGGEQSGLVWMKNDLAGAMAKARAEGKRVLVNFTGYACTNCHWMKQNMFTRPAVAGVMKGMVLVDLYTDGEDAPSQANQKLEQDQFQTIAIPFYVLYEPGAAGSEPKVLATFPGLTRDEAAYMAFLNTPGSAPAPPTVAGGVDLGGITTLEGAALDPAQYTGKVLVVNFWATWCVPCRKEIPEFNALFKDMSGKGVAVLGVSADEGGAAVVKPYLGKTPLAYPVALASERTKTLFQLDNLPVTVIFGRDGKLIKRFDGLTPGDQIRAVVTAAS